MAKISIANNSITLCHGFLLSDIPNFLQETINKFHLHNANQNNNNKIAKNYSEMWNRRYLAMKQKCQSYADKVLGMKTRELLANHHFRNSHHPVPHTHDKVNIWIWNTKRYWMLFTKISNLSCRCAEKSCSLQRKC